MNTFNPGVSGLVLVMVAIAAVSDLRSHRIPNWLIATGLLAALLLQVFEHGAGGGSRAWLTGALAGLAPFLVLYLAGALGADDAKLMASIGAFVGVQPALQIVVASFLLGGVMALAIMVARKNARQTLAGLSALLLWLPFGWRATAAGTARTETTARLPYVVALAGGVLLVTTGTL